MYIDLLKRKTRPYWPSLQKNQRCAVRHVALVGEGNKCAVAVLALLGIVWCCWTDDSATILHSQQEGPIWLLKFNVQ